jgi:hypothetical protein
MLIIKDGQLTPQVNNALGGGITLVPFFASRLAQFIDDHIRGWVGRVTHAQVNDVYIFLAQAVFERIDATKQVGRQAAHPGRGDRRNVHAQQGFGREFVIDFIYLIHKTSSFLVQKMSLRLAMI